MPIPVVSSLIAAYPWLEPYLKEIGLRGAVALGGYGLGKLMGSPEQTAYQQQLAWIQRLQPEYLNLLQKQMRGEPTAASEAIRRQVAQEGRAAGQSLATSAARMGQGGTAVVRAQQERLAEAEMQALSDRLAEAQLRAQEQVGGLIGGTQQQQALLAQQEASEMSELMRYLAAGVGDVAMRELIQEYINALSGTTTQPLMQTAPTTFMPEVSYEPMSQWYGKTMRERLAGLPRSTSTTLSASPTIVPTTTTVPRTSPPTDVTWLSQQTGFVPQLIAQGIESASGNVYIALLHLYLNSTPGATLSSARQYVDDILNRWYKTYTPSSASATQTEEATGLPDYGW